MYVIKNNKDRILNLGTKQGNMLMFEPSEIKEVSEDMVSLFESEILHYEQGGMLKIETKKKQKTQKTMVDNETPNTVSESKPKKRTTRRSKKSKKKSE